jgi:hypothetical protein
VQVGVELTEHHLGQGLADLVLVGVLADPVTGGGAEWVGHRSHRPGGAAVLDHLTGW